LAICRSLLCYRSSLGAQVGWLRLNKTDKIFNTYKDPSTGPTSAHYELIFSVCIDFSFPHTKSSPILLNLPPQNGVLPLAGQTPLMGDYLTVFTNVVSPYARGSVTLRSSHGLDAPIVNPNLLGHPFDVHVLVEAVKATRRFLTGRAWKDYILAPLGDEFAHAKTDAQIERYARNNAGTVWHATGTASMSPKGAVWGVVDPDLKVKGVAGLRVADASVLRTSLSIFFFADSRTEKHSQLTCPAVTP
jgi:choline dehydrogenase-like flavoprotein